MEFRFMRLLGLIILALTLLLGVSFAILNAQTVVVNYYLGTKALPLSVLLVGIFIIGIVIGFVVSLPSIIRLKLKIRRQRKGQG